MQNNPVHSLENISKKLSNFCFYNWSVYFLKWLLPHYIDWIQNDLFQTSHHEENRGMYINHLGDSFKVCLLFHIKVLPSTHGIWY